jgi:hypothetical protein
MGAYHDERVHRLAQMTGSRETAERLIGFSTRYLVSFGAYCDRLEGNIQAFGVAKAEALAEAGELLNLEQIEIVRDVAKEKVINVYPTMEALTLAMRTAELCAVAQRAIGKAE